MLPPGVPPPNLRAYLDNNEVVLTWDEVECTQQNSNIMFYNVQYNILGENPQVRFVQSPETMIRSSPIEMDNKMVIPDLNQRYQFRVRAAGRNQFGPLSSILEVVPASLGKCMHSL